ncbi:putative 26S proteasome non-ATPase regulatory subunit Nas2 [Aspergillus saccharolyticus JOP 1030-1]|uniref:Probable 26S proteasome regulatory subunit p27 n=1 Tax=Aspergillus saccharolyticus JOP 1030-1 TaxID=1450539 RepID=A0A318ZJB3_9EURO|nr:26S proteasome non-ATPase regulatory subunit Nas2 [Aspergillus saccharolyticus JOP 1030-1]PYH46917.1 26S proteasome non-ATPase regulatory subunit Nas2 [Aspergillus saccharolyticus JOP 1030-1]
MDTNSNIHAPTVASGPTSGEAPSRDLSKLGVVDLMQEKERIEEELSALSSVLSSHGVHMNTSLTTFDGYPRDDIDVAQIRTTRARIIRLRTDHKEVMSLLEKGIHDHFASLQRAQTTAPSDGSANNTQTGQASATSNGDSRSEAAGVPFAKVNSVVAGSPADQAGLKAGDTVRSFGSVNWLNHERLSKVAQVVQQNEGRAVTVAVARKDPNSIRNLELSLELTPRRDWGGRGLLGCHLVPL